VGCISTHLHSKKRSSYGPRKEQRGTWNGWHKEEGLTSGEQLPADAVNVRVTQAKGPPANSTCSFDHPHNQQHKTWVHMGFVFFLVQCILLCLCPCPCLSLYLSVWSLYDLQTPTHLLSQTKKIGSRKKKSLNCDPMVLFCSIIDL
jgi:hypothetical protein